jgi:SAM-dependent MidA family methyltransferase
MNFAQFMELALYHPTLGYYRRNRSRVGYGRGTDFYTATTSGAVFGELVAAAAVKLLAGRPPKDFTFVEIGAEPGGGVLANVPHPFRDARTIRVGEDIRLSGPSVVFSNELFDAQPFHRYVFREGAWHEIAVRLVGESLAETFERTAKPAFLPESAPEGYVVDAPWAARELIERIVAEPWTGVFIACDYGKSWKTLIEETPRGTARAYSQHRQVSDLLAQPGQQDLTCHVCWDWLRDGLSAGGFKSVTLESQEAFFIRNAADYIAATSAAEASRFSQKKLSLLQLLHPSHLGQKFDVLHGVR